MKHSYIIIHIGCNNDIDQKNIIINVLNDKFGDWYDTTLRKNNIDPQYISGITIGPHTILETFHDSFMSLKNENIVNNSDKEIYKDIGCKDNDAGMGSVRSFRVWNYEYYRTLNGSRFCANNDECRLNELCLCPGGEVDKNYCIDEKQRCLPKSEYWHDKKKIHTLNEDTKLNPICISNKLNEISKNKNYINYSKLKEIFNSCVIPMSKSNKDKKDELMRHYYYKYDKNMIEGFGGNKINKKKYIFYFILFFCLLMYLL